MAHDPLFEQRIAEALKAHGAKAEPKKMFGGVAFMVNGHMSVGITNQGDFMARFDGARHEEVLKWPGAKPMTFGKAGMKGFLFVDADAVSTKAALDKWIKLSLAYVNALPKKRAKGAIKKEASGKKVVRKK
ncbi:MAG: TfoX/Sxy family protein [Bacteroidetes bacterium]|nr:TfoX/Sxy family protein [Bacteroidota bacterium]MBX7127814.1 TfoX/Sxy family protein [Flavobacteriales bacterium]MCC6656365.1 TfoX/Sxy family protein [Flavobacteriales bacterium]HMU12588.1 TfoX/Sxy family protein [Flavobacteriales bacterium]HMW96177.1 TfoX/Sxy family protein [Flavobacteriales bacterium]